MAAAAAVVVAAAAVAAVAAAAAISTVQAGSAAPVVVLVLGCAGHARRTAECACVMRGWLEPVWVQTCADCAVACAVWLSYERC